MAAHALPRWLQYPHALPLPAARRRWAGGLLVLAVALAHQGVLQGLADRLRRPAPASVPEARPAPRSWVRLLPAPPEPAPAVAPAPALPPPPPRPRRLALAPPPLQRPPAPTAAPSPAPAQPAPAALADEGAALQPPVYPTLVPPPRTLRFTLRRGAQVGEGEWRWQAGDGHFESRLQATLGGRPLVDQLSTGGFDAAGLAPLRQLEHGRGRSAQAVNFQREKGLLSFSGSPRSWALWPATQDRLSWLPQLLAVLAARPAGQAGDPLRLAVAGADGGLDLWDWRLEPQAAPDGSPALHWVREPARPYDHRIELWLEPAAPHWPLAWRWQRLPGGEPVTWTRLAEAP